MISVPLLPLSTAEQDSLMTEVEIRSDSVATKKYKHPINWLRAHLCQNKFTCGLCLSLVLAIAIVISLLCLYLLHTRIQAERKCTRIALLCR